MKLKQLNYDIVVLGAGPGGFPAALAAARMGKKVLVVEKNGYIGGNAVSGLPFLGFLDRHGRQVVGGIAQELIDDLLVLNASYPHARCPLHNSVTVVDPQILRLVMTNKLLEAGVDILLHSQVIEVQCENRQIRRVITAGKGDRALIEASCFVDATGDGDAAYLAGCSFEKGMEGNGVMQPPTLMFSLCNFDAERFYEYLDAHPEDLIPSDTINVAEDIAAYNSAFFRANPSHVFLGLRSTLAKLQEQGLNPLKRDTLIYINTPRPGEIYINSTRVPRFDGSDSFDLTRGELESLEQITALVSVLRENIPGFENAYINVINPAIGVRESRRFAGRSRLTIDHVLNGHIPEDTVALGAYKVDIHSGTGDGTLLQELDGPYGIPLGCMISADLENLLLSGRCISMDAKALGSMRIMPTCMAIGHGVGVCAALAVEKNLPLSQVDPLEVAGVLKKGGAILSV